MQKLDTAWLLRDIVYLAGYFLILHFFAPCVDLSEETKLGHRPPTSPFNDFTPISLSGQGTEISPSAFNEAPQDKVGQNRTCECSGNRSSPLFSGFGSSFLLLPLRKFLACHHTKDPQKFECKEEEVSESRKDGDSGQSGRRHERGTESTRQRRATVEGQYGGGIAGVKLCRSANLESRVHFISRCSNEHDLYPHETYSPPPLAPHRVRRHLLLLCKGKELLRLGHWERSIRQTKQ
eukprot:752906-Hanusia_phi.AAC.2